jgi:hypothetical protein
MLARQRRYYGILGGLSWNILVKFEGFLLKHMAGNFKAAIHHVAASCEALAPGSRPSLGMVDFTSE